jgi:hypothetical protein
LNLNFEKNPKTIKPCSNLFMTQRKRLKEGPRTVVCHMPRVGGLVIVCGGGQRD